MGQRVRLGPIITWHLLVEFTQGNDTLLDIIGIRYYEMIDRDFLRGFVKIYTLWRAGQEEVYGLQIAEEMKELGFELSPGTLYPALHALRAERDVTVRDRIVDGKRRKCYRVTAKGQRELAELQGRLAVLMRKIFPPDAAAGNASRKSATKKGRR